MCGGVEVGGEERGGGSPQRPGRVKMSTHQIVANRAIMRLVLSRKSTHQREHGPWVR